MDNKIALNIENSHVFNHLGLKVYLVTDFDEVLILLD